MALAQTSTSGHAHTSAEVSLATSAGKSECRRRQGLSRIRLHDMRHTWATLALEAGIPVEIVAERLGHSGDLRQLGLGRHQVRRPVNRAGFNPVD